MATFKEISDGIITQVVALDAFNSKTVQEFHGGIAAFLEETYNLPFCGVSLESAAYDEYNSANTTAIERLTFKLWVAAEDFRGQKYATADNYTLLESIRGTLLGDSLSLAGVNPIQIESIEKDEDAADQGIAAYTMTISTFQAR